MTKTPIRWWLVTEAQFKGYRAAHQIEIVEAAEADFSEVGPGYGRNADARWRQIARACELREAKLGIGRPARQSGGASKVGITASECNAFLRSLPPVHLYGEDG